VRWNFQVIKFNCIEYMFFFRYYREESGRLWSVDELKYIRIQWVLERVWSLRFESKIKPETLLLSDKNHKECNASASRKVAFFRVLKINYSASIRLFSNFVILIHNGRAINSSTKVFDWFYSPKLMLSIFCYSYSVMFPKPLFQQVHVVIQHT